MLTSHAIYVKSKLPEVDIQDFFIHFGFKHKKTAEQKFRDAVTTIYNQCDNIELKDYIEKEFINDEFESLESTHLDEYWLNTQRLSNDLNTSKRKAEVAIIKRSSKDRKLSSTLTKNKIVDLSNEGPSGQSNTMQWKLSKDTESIIVIPQLLDEEFKKNIQILFNKHDHMDIPYFKSLKYQLNCTSYELYKYKILTHIIEQYQINPSTFIIEQQLQMSERDFEVRIYGRLFQLLFSNKPEIIIKNGDTNLDGFKVDIRIGFKHNDTFYDISVIEIGKQATNTKVKEDHVKLLLEVKSIFKNLISTFNFINPTHISIPVLQFCGLKGDMMITEIRKPKQITATRASRIRLPLSITDNQTMQNFMEQLSFYKYQVVNTTDYVKKEINYNNDRRRSFGKTLNKQTLTTNSVSYKNWI